MTKEQLDDDVQGSGEVQGTLRRVLNEIVASIRKSGAPRGDGRTAGEGGGSAVANEVAEEVAEEALEARRGTSTLLDSILKTLESAAARASKKTQLNTWVYRERFRFVEDVKATPSAQSSARSGGAHSNDTLDLARGWALLPKGAVEIEPANATSKGRFPRLYHGLHKVVCRTGVAPVYDGVEGKYNFSKDLHILHDPDKVRHNVFPKYTTPSRDVQLKKLARKQRRAVKFRSSTSAMTGVLSLLYHTVSNYRPTTLTGLSKIFSEKRCGFTKHVYAPTALVMYPEHHRSGSCALDKVDNFDETVLSQIGTHIESLLTMDTATFRETALTESTVAAEAAKKLLPKQAYNFSCVGDFLVRAQIDCHRRVRKGREFFEIKTRAVAPMRYNLAEFYKYVNYKINRAKGLEHSYELEFYDMVRSTFIKYIMQIRLGRMRGALVCFHNTKEIFGFEYYTVEEMEKYVFGSSYWAKTAFGHSVKLLEVILHAARKEFPEDRKYKLKMLFQLSDDCGVHVFVYRFIRGEDPMDYIASGAATSGSNIADYLKRAGLTKKNLVQFRLEVRTFVNGAESGGGVKAAPGDDVRVAYSLQRVDKVDYQRLRDVARLVNVAEEFDIRHLPQPAKQFFRGSMPEVLASVIGASKDLDSVQESMQPSRTG